VARRSLFLSCSWLLTAVLIAGCRPAADGRSDRPREDVSLVRDVTTTEATVPRNATLESLLLQQELSADAARSVVDAVRTVFNPRHLRADQPYAITRGLDGLLREFRYDIDPNNLLRVRFPANPDASAAFDVAVEPVLREYHPQAVSARISAATPSLIEAFNAAGETIQLPMRLSEVFGGEVDFNSELQRGDVVEVLFDRATRAGAFVGYGEVKAAVLTVGQRRVTAIRYEGQDGNPDFYDDEGRSLQRQFLRSPFPFTPRVTSGFSYNRFHPVHRRSRPHLGVDYGAPFGTRVNAVADGVIEAAEWAGEAGRMVRIRHAGGYETAYLHLSSFGPGIRPGVRVEQGDQIGRVGQSGTATGPHLDYRIIKNGVYVNPIAELAKMPHGEELSDEAMDDFRRVRDAIIAELHQRLAPSSSPSGANPSR
jgi:murein DD-endopeptidase MepM/ murein hydrolase activator NlpD